MYMKHAQKHTSGLTISLELLLWKLITTYDKNIKLKDICLQNSVYNVQFSRVAECKGVPFS